MIIYWVFWSVKFIVKPIPSFLVSFIDVGQGDSIFITYNDRRFIIDTGYNYEVSVKINNYVPFFMCDIDSLFITHVDYDHLGGASRLLSQCDIKSHRFNDVVCMSKTCESYSMYLTDKLVINTFTGDSIIDTNFELKTLWPLQEKYYGNKINDINDYSTIQLLKYKDFEVLLTGDASYSVLDEISKDVISGVTGRLDVLKLPHHGSKTGLHDELFTKLDPEYCVLSVGKENKYGHPDSEVISFLEGLNCKILRTDIDGTIEFKAF